MTKGPGITMWKLDGQGGIVPQDLGRAKKVDLITLPEDLPGTNCGNCRFYVKARHWCQHEEVRQHVNERNCCAEWDSKGTLRAWEKGK